jgi:hypothetical protein
MACMASISAFTLEFNMATVQMKYEDIVILK